MSGRIKKWRLERKQKKERIIRGERHFRVRRKLLVARTQRLNDLAVAFSAAGVRHKRVAREALEMVSSEKPDRKKLDACEGSLKDEISYLEGVLAEIRKINKLESKAPSAPKGDFGKFLPEIRADLERTKAALKTVTGLKRALK